jgi:anti-sigma-K factor RskA
MALERAAREDERLSRTPVWRRVAVAAVAAAVLVGAFAVGTRVDGGGDGTLELEAVLRAPGQANVVATATVRKTGIGRVIEFRSDELPILPKGEYYELWFAAPAGKYISAGTFHPDENGRSHVTFAAAVDPALYPVLSVTAEPGDGNPARTGPEVLRSHAP